MKTNPFIYDLLRNVNGRKETKIINFLDNKLFKKILENDKSYIFSREMMRLLIMNIVNLDYKSMIQFIWNVCTYNLYDISNILEIEHLGTVDDFLNEFNQNFNNKFIME